MAPAPAHQPRSSQTQSRAGTVSTKTNDGYYGHEKMAALCARFIHFLFQCPISPPGMTAQQVRLPYFIAYAIHRTRLHPCVTYAALVLLQRLKARFPTAKGSSGHRLFISAFMIASKVICDDTYSNRSWSIVAQGIFTLREMNQMERELCNYLDWELSVTEPILGSFTEMVERDFGPHASEPYPTYSLQMVSKRAAKIAATTGSTPAPEFSSSSSPIPMFTQQRNATPVKGTTPSPPKKRRGSFAQKPVSLPRTDSPNSTPPHSYSNSTTPESSPSPRTPIDAEDIQVEVRDYGMDKGFVAKYKTSGLKAQIYSRPTPAIW